MIYFIVSWRFGPESFFKLVSHFDYSIVIILFHLIKN